MPAELKIERVDVRETIKALRKIDPEVAKEFRKGIRDVLKPVMSEIKTGYPPLPLSGMQYKWTPRDYAILPWDVGQARRGVKLKISTRRDRNSVVYISQGYPAAVIFEAIQSSNVPLGQRIRAREPRNIWPTVDRHTEEINRGVGDLVRQAEQTVQQELG